MNTITLYRPVGKTELLLIEKSGFKAFPPRLDWQPIFYPVLNQDYAEKIALDWNTRDSFSGNAGFVMEFVVDRVYINQFPVKNVGARTHNEIWVPSQEMDVFNSKIKNEIRIVNAFFGEAFETNDNPVLEDLFKKFRK